MGAQDFAIYYFKAYDWGYSTNDPTLVEKISAPTCRACKIYSNSLRHLTSAGGTLRGGHLTLLSARIYPGRIRIKAEYAVDVAVNEQQIEIAQPGLPTRVIAAQKDHHSLVFVRWQAGGWQIAEVTAR